MIHLEVVCLQVLSLCQSSLHFCKSSGKTALERSFARLRPTPDSPFQLDEYLWPPLLDLYPLIWRSLSPSFQFKPFKPSFQFKPFKPTLFFGETGCRL